MWYKANPLLGQGLDIERIREEYINAKAQPSKIPNFKTKHLNMWVDAPSVWIPSETWKANKHNLTADQVLAKFQQFGGFSGVDLATTKDITPILLLSNPDECGDRYLVPFFFCPKDTIERRSKDDRVPYDYWVNSGFMIATPGNRTHYPAVEDKIKGVYKPYNIERFEFDPWNAEQMTQNLQEADVNVSYFEQGIGTISKPTKEFEKLVLEGKMRHDGNPVLSWMLGCCQIYTDANENIKVHKGWSNVQGRRVDGIVAAIMALGGSMSIPPETNESVYNNPDTEFVC